jgi:D-alanyl-D-alanine carboxypeptidase
MGERRREKMTDLTGCLRQHLIAQSVAKVPLLAASVAIKHGDERWATVITASDPGQIVISVDSRFLVQSLTKSFTAAVILRLVEAGKLLLDEPLARWLASVPNAACVTIRQCLQHTSGLPDYGPLKEYHDAVRRGDKPWSFQEFLEHTGAERLRFEPGKGWGYSNIGYMILRRLIERVYDRTFSDIIMTEIVLPLGLTQTFVVRDRADLLSLTAGYSTNSSSDGSAIDVREFYDPGWIATGVIASTASEVVWFYEQLFSGKVVSPALLNEMCSIVRVAPSHPRFVTPSYGLGLMADPDSPYGAMYGHNGGGPGYSASAYHFRSPQEPITIAVLLNIENSEAAEIMVLATTKALAEV